MIPGFSTHGAMTHGAFDGDASTANPRAALLIDSLGAKTILLKACPYDPITLESPCIYISNNAYASGVGDTLPDGTSLPHQLFRGRLIQPLSFETRVMQGTELTDAVPAFGSTAVAVADGDTEIRKHLRYHWDGAELLYLLGRKDWALSEFAPIAKAVASDVEADPLTYRISYRDVFRRLQVPVRTGVYAGRGPCLRGDGSSAYGSATITCPANSLTIECLVRPRTSASTTKSIAGWRNGTAAGGRRLALLSTGTNLPTFDIRNDAGVLHRAAGVTALSTHRWYHLAGVLDTAASQVRLYVDGELVATTALTGTWATQLTTFVVLRQPDSAAEYADVDIDELRVWPAARTQAEIKASREYEMTVTTQTGYWQFNEATGATAFDETANNYDLALSGSYSWVGSLEGGAEIKGTRKYRRFGPFFELQPVPVDPNHHVYQFHDGAVDAVTSVKVAGAAGLTFDADVADPYAWTPVAGKYATCIARGYLILQAAPQGVLTVSGRGDKLAGVYVSSGPDIIQRLASEILTYPDEFDVASFATAEAANSAALQVGTGSEEVTYYDVIRGIARQSLGGWATMTQDGLLALGILDRPGTPTRVLGLADVVLDSPQKLVTSTPPTLTKLGYAQYLTTQTTDALATSLAEDVQRDLGQAYRFVATPEDSDIVANYPAAVPSTEETHYALEADALAEAARRQTLREDPFYALRLPLTRGQYQDAIGDDLELDAELTLMLLGIDATAPCTVVAISVDFGEYGAADSTVLEVVAWPNHPYVDAGFVEAGYVS